MFGSASGRRCDTGKNEASLVVRFPSPAAGILENCERRMANDQRPTTDLLMKEPNLKPAPLAYENKGFLDSPDGRILRLLSEYSEPLSRFRREQIQDTVVFFGSARIASRDSATNQLSGVRGNGESVAELQRTADIKHAE